MRRVGIAPFLRVNPEIEPFAWFSDSRYPLNFSPNLRSTELTLPWNSVTI